MKIWKESRKYKKEAVSLENKSISFILHWVPLRLHFYTKRARYRSSFCIYCKMFLYV